MGSCISKCRPKKHFHIREDQFDHFQDKLVISQLAPPPPPPPRSASIPAASSKISPSPPSPSHSTSSASSFTCSSTSASSTSASNTSSLSSASSALSSKERSFSNEFLWSCYKENSHITRINSIKEATFSSQKPVLATARKKQQPNPKRVSGSSSTIPQKRVRPSSPTPLTRQKSFRRDPPERPILISAPHSLPSRTLLMRSPSPSRRFIMANPNPPKDQSHSRKENLGPPGPKINNSSRAHRPGLKSRETETYIHRISSKIDEVAVREALADHYLDSLHAEDIDNPLISLDCFIFL